MKEKWNKYKDYFIAPAIVAVIILIVYLSKGIYPFGNLTIANGDVGQSYMAFYHFLYDIVYFGKSILYDYTLGLGSNMYGGFMVEGLANPTSWIVLLSARENIAYMFSFVLLLKFMLIALTSYIAFNKFFKNNKFYNIIFSVLYALSGYTLMYNTNLMWLDVVALFPLFIISIDYMFKEDKIYWFAIILTLMLIFNYNLSYMVLMFIIFILPIYIKFGIPKEKRKKAVFNVIIGTVLSVGLSAFSFIPSFIQVMQSYRFSGNTVNAVTNDNIAFKIAIFFFYIVPLYGYIKWLKHYKEDKKDITINVLSLVFCAIIPIIFERVNLLWHTGSYQMFPFRYGFIPTMIMYFGALRYYSKFEEKELKKKKILDIDKYIAFVLATYVIFVECANSVTINSNIPAFNMNMINVSIMITAIFSLSVILYFLENMENQKIAKKIIAFIVIIETLIYSYAYIGVPKEYRYGAEWSDDAIFISYEIKKDFNIKEDLYRIKDLTAMTTENMSLVYSIPSMSTFLHIISTNQVLNCQQLGYSNNNTKINDYGGTILSDSIYGIKYVLSKEDLSEKIYNFVKEDSYGIKLYEYKNVLPIGIKYENEIEQIPEELTDFDAQNYLYQKIFNKSDNIITKLDNNFEKNENKYYYNIKVNDANELYMYATKTNLIKSICVNGKEKIIPITNDLENKIYPTKYNNGILDLGTFENEEVKLEIECFEDEIDNVKLGLLDLKKYDEIFEIKQPDVKISVDKNKIKINGYVEEDTNILIPINYDKGWEIGKSSSNNTEIKKVYNNFIGINVNKGEISEELVFYPPQFKLCIKITLITIALMIVMYFVRKKYDIRNIKILMYIFWILGIIIYIVCIFRFYIVSIIQTFI